VISAEPTKFVHPWQLASVLFFTYVAVAAIALARLQPGTRLRVLGGAFLGLAITAASRQMPEWEFPRTWILPPLLLLCAYWSSGGLFVAPMPAVEQSLERVDRILHIDRLASLATRPVAELLEFAYSAIYPTIPLALLIAVQSGESADRFWNVILITDYVCFAFLALIQTRPPRAFRAHAPWKSSWRRVNLHLLRAASIEVNTFPSGHAAEALAAALMSSRAPDLMVAFMYVNALAISAGAVFGRYHYASDALTGWLIAVVVWYLV
jgi:hypothetical protein